MWLQHLPEPRPSRQGLADALHLRFQLRLGSQNSWGICAFLQLWVNTSSSALWLVRTKCTSCFKSLTSQQHWPDWLGLQSTDLFPPLVTVLRVCSGALLASDGLSTGPSDEWHQAGEDRCVAKRLPGIFGPNCSIWCQEDHPPAGTLFRLYRKGGWQLWTDVTLSLIKPVREHWGWMLGAGHQAGCTFHRLVQGVPSQHSGDVLIGSTLAFHRVAGLIWWYYFRPLRHPKKWHWGWAAVLGCCLPAWGHVVSTYIRSVTEGRRRQYQSHLFHNASSC